MLIVIGSKYCYNKGKWNRNASLSNLLYIGTIRPISMSVRIILN